MKASVKRQLARFFCGNAELNRKALCMKRSWDEVEGILNGSKKKKESGKGGKKRKRHENI